MTADTTTRYLGIMLKNPLVASASPLTGDIESLQQLENAGAAAVVLPSLFEEQLIHDEQQFHALHEHHGGVDAESQSHFPDLLDYNLGPLSYLNLIKSAKSSLSIPVIGSLNGASTGGWERYARAIEDAGADALELNIYFVPTDPEVSSKGVEDQYVDLVGTIRKGITIPLAVKIGPQFSSLPHFVGRLAEAGADGLVLFNRFLEPDIDLHTLQIAPRLFLSNHNEYRLPMQWIAILRDQLLLSLAATSGVHTPADAIKLLLVGADAVMLTSVLLNRGVNHLHDFIAWLHNWLDVNEYDSIEQLKGSMSHQNCPDPRDLERTNYVKTLMSYTNTNSVNGT